MPSQKLDSAPPPSVVLTLFQNQLPSLPSTVDTTLFYHPDRRGILPSLITPSLPHLNSPNLDFTTFDQRLSFSLKNLHTHFPSKALLNTPRFLTPSPPCVIGVQILSQLTQASFFSSPLPPHRNRRKRELNFFFYRFRKTREG